MSLKRKSRTKRLRYSKVPPRTAVWKLSDGDRRQKCSVSHPDEQLRYRWRRPRLRGIIANHDILNTVKIEIKIYGGAGVPEIV